MSKNLTPTMQDLVVTEQANQMEFYRRRAGIHTKAIDAATRRVGKKLALHRMRKDQKNLRRLRRTVANAKRDLRKGVVPESQIAGLEMAIARAESAIPKSSVGRWDRLGRRV